MAIQTVNIGAIANDGTGDDPRTGISKINDNFTDPANAASKLVQDTPTDLTAGSVVITEGLLNRARVRNMLINSDFSVNQEGVTGSVVLAAGEYGHDMFKAGAGGCSYTFAKLSGVTTITISAGSLLQIVGGSDLESKPVVLSWTGTAQGRIDAGAYGLSGAVTATTTGGANFTAEFNTGTLSKVQLEDGSNSTPFETQGSSAGDELFLCQGYFEIGSGSIRTAPSPSNLIGAHVAYKATKHSLPVISYLSNGPVTANLTFQSFLGSTLEGSGVQFSTAGAEAYGYGFTVSADSRL